MQKKLLKGENKVIRKTNKKEKKNPHGQMLFWAHRPRETGKHPKVTLAESPFLLHAHINPVTPEKH